jgi:hypothetical protein
MYLFYYYFYNRSDDSFLYVELEWRHGRGGHLTLQDEDLTTKSICGWKKLNTLAHYGVKESAVMSLIPRQNDSFNANCKQPCQNCEFTTQYHCLFNLLRAGNGLSHSEAQFFSAFSVLFANVSEIKLKLKVNYF